MNWNDYFLNMAHSASLKAKDTTKVGCVIVGEDQQIVSTGWNGMARGVSEHPHLGRHKRPEKYNFTIHAEANAICNAARHGIRLKGCTLYVTHKPCQSCTDLIIQSGIVKVVHGLGETIGKQEFGYDNSDIKFYEAGIEMEIV